jgi:hypothetical protein
MIRRKMVSAWEANPNVKKAKQADDRLSLAATDGVGWTNPARKRRGLMRAASGRLPIRSLAASGHTALSTL